MNKKTIPVRFPLIQPDRRTHFNFFSVCIKAIKDNKEGVIDKNECIKNINKLKEEQSKLLLLKTRKKFPKPSFYNLSQTKLTFKNKTQKIINKRRYLSDILKEAEQMEKEQEKNANSCKNAGKSENKKENKDLYDKKSKSFMYNNEKKKTNKSSLSNANKSAINIKKDNYQYGCLRLKKMNEYLESNDLTLYEIAQHNPFQRKPYEISKGDKFIKAVMFQQYDNVREALQTSRDFLFVFDYFGQTGYHWAAKLGNIKMLSILLDYGKYHNQRDFKGRTPLYLAAVNNNKEVCEFLLRRGANIHLKDNNGNSAADVAGSKELKYYLQDFMTQPFSNPNFVRKINDFKNKIEELEKAKLEKQMLAKDGENNNNEEEEKEDEKEINFL
jgi:hypothetical protein